MIFTLRMWIYLTRIMIFSAVRKVYLSIVFLHFPLPVQWNRSWGHHLGVIPVSITQWRIEIGIFHTRFSRVSKSRFALSFCNYCTIAFYFVYCMALTLFICGDSELNPGIKKLNLIISHFATKISTVFLLITFY